MENCEKCGVSLLKMVLSSDEESEMISYRCPSCGDAFIKEEPKQPLDIEEEGTTPTPTRKISIDKHVKIHRDIWHMANDFVQENKIMYPSIKFFTQQAIIEKIKREKNNVDLQ